jgi:glycosyltransferase involved in cell wall biosynthesis
MTDRLKASIIIPTYKRPKLLRHLLESLVTQRTEQPFEVVVVNDDPDDDISHLLQAMAGLDLKIINLKQDRGRAIARNTGVENTDGDILIFLDDDMTVVPDFISRHLEEHRDRMCAVIGNIVSAPQFSSDPLARYIERQGAKKRKPGQALPPRCFRTGNASVSRYLFHLAGAFDESLRTYGEDIDLAMRLSYKGARFIFAEGAISYNNDPPDLEDLVAKLREWGRFTLPVHAPRHPALARALWLHLAEPMKPGRESPILTFKKMGIRITLTPPFYALACLVYRLKWLGRILFPVIDFIRVYNYLNEYRRALASG